MIYFLYSFSSSTSFSPQEHDEKEKKKAAERQENIEASAVSTPIEEEKVEAGSQQGDVSEVEVGEQAGEDLFEDNFSDFSDDAEDLLGKTEMKDKGVILSQETQVTTTAVDEPIVSKAIIETKVLFYLINRSEDDSDIIFIE